MRKVYIFITAVFLLGAFQACETPNEDVIDRTESTGNGRGTGSENEEVDNNKDDNTEGKEDNNTEEPRDILTGEYLASAQSMQTDNYGNSLFDEHWVAHISRDESNECVLYIHPICTFLGIAASAISPVYASIDTTSNCLSVEYGQSLTYDEETDCDYVFAGVNDDMTPTTTGYATATYHCNKAGKYVIEFHNNIGVANISTSQSPRLVQAISNVKFEMK